MYTFCDINYHYPIDSLIFWTRSLISGDSSAIKIIEYSLYKLINDSNSSKAFKPKKLTIIYKMRKKYDYHFLNND